MSGQGQHPSGRSAAFEERYRLYLDESGDHVFNYLEPPSHRYFCLLGCWFRNADYLVFHDRLEAFKNRCGDVLAESRGGREDHLLMDSYARVYAQGIWMSPAAHFQRALTSKQLKVKKKSENIAGLQLADLLGHPVRQAILQDEGLLPEGLAPFGARLMPVLERKLNRHLYDGRAEGYGKVFFPK